MNNIKNKSDVGLNRVINYFKKENVKSMENSDNVNNADNIEKDVQIKKLETVLEADNKSLDNLLCRSAEMKDRMSQIESEQKALEEKILTIDLNKKEILFQLKQQESEYEQGRYELIENESIYVEKKKLYEISKKKLDLLQGDSTQLIDKLHYVVQKKNKLTTQLKGLEEKETSMIESCRNKRLEVDRERNNLILIQEELMMRGMDYDNLQTELQTLDNDIDFIENQIKVKNKNMKDAELKINELLLYRTELTNKLAEKKNCLVEVSEKFNGLNEQFASTIKNVDILKKNISAISIEITNVDENNKTIGEEKQLAQKEFENLESNLLNLEKTLKKKEDAHDKSIDVNKSIAGKIDQDKEKISGMQIKISKLEDDIINFKEARNALKNDMQVSCNIKHELNAEIESLSETYEKLSKDNEMGIKSLASYEKEICDNKTAHAILKKDFNELNDRKVKLNQQIPDEENNLKQLNKQIKIKTAELQLTQNCIESLSAKIEEVKLSKKQSVQSIEGLDLKLMKSLEALDNKNDTLKEKRNELNLIRKKNIFKSQQLEETDSDLLQIESKINFATSELQIQYKKKDSLERQNTELVRKIDVNKSSLCNLERKNKELLSKIEDNKKQQFLLCENYKKGAEQVTRQKTNHSINGNEYKRVALRDSPPLLLKRRRNITV